MTRVSKLLTNTEVKQAKVRDKEYSLTDGKGLMISIRPTGTKNWIFKYSKTVTKKRIYSIVP
jgi:hypothetical protein